VQGIAAGALGVAARDATGFAAGLVLVDVRNRMTGISVSGLWSLGGQRLDGLGLAGGAVVPRDLTGLAVGGFGAGAERRLTGAAVSPGGVYGSRIRGIAVGGVGVGTEHCQGIALTLGGMGGRCIDGVAIAGLGLGATERVRGLAAAGVVAFAPEVTGVMVGGLNGVYLDRIDLEDFLHFEAANRRFTGLSVGLVNYSARLRGVQVGLLNYAGNNPPWLRLLPFINVHL